MANIGLEIDDSDLLAELNKTVEDIDGQINSALSYAAKAVVRDARNVRNTYTDQTGALRSSLGYAIIDAGQVIEEDIEQIQAGPRQDAEGNTYQRPGSNAGVAITEAAAEYSSVKGAVVVAGMPYASYVEQKGYDVLTGSALKLEDYFKEGME